MPPDESSDEHYRTLAEVLPQIVFSALPNGQPDYLNGHWYAYTGAARGDDAYATWHAALHPDDLACATEAWRRSLETGEPFEVEYRLRGADGIYRWFLALGTPQHDRSGKIVRWFGVATDIDRQKREEAKQRFLARLSGETRALADPDDVMWAAMRLLGEHLRASRCRYAEVDEEADQITTRRDFRTEGPSVTGVFRLSAFGPLLIGDLRAGRTAVVADTIADPRTAADYETTYRALAIRSFISAPLIKDERLVCVLTVSMLEPRNWTQDEVDLIEEVVGHTWLAVESAVEGQERRRAEEALRTAEARFRMLVEQSPLSIQILAPDGATIQVNGAWERLWGLTVDDLQGYNMLEDQQLVEKGIMPYIQRAFAGEAVSIPAIVYDTDQTLPNRSKHGDPRRWTEALAYPVKDGAGRTREVVLIHHDITDRKQMEDLLRGREKQMRLVADSAPAYISHISTDFRFLFANRSSAARFGLTPDQIAGKSIEEVLGRSAFEVIRPQMERAFAGETVSYETTVPYEQLGDRFMQVFYAPDRADDGSIVGLVAVVHDITGRRELEIRLREESKVLEVINDVGRRLSAELDLERMVQAATDAATELTGARFGAFFYNVFNATGESYTLYTIAGVPRERFSHFPMPRNTAVFAPTFAGERTVRYDDVTQQPEYGGNPPYHGKPPGHLPVVSYLAVPVVSRSGEVLGGLFFGHEQPGVFTERHERIVEGLAAQAAIAIDNARLFQAERERSGQLAMAVREVHHRVKNSLQGVTALLEMQLTPGESMVPAEAIRDSLSQIKTIALVHDLLAHDQPIGNVDTAKVLAKLVSMLSVTLGTVGAPLAIGLDAESVLLPIRPAIALALAVNELITNAAKHSQPDRASAAVVSNSIARSAESRQVSSHHDASIQVRLLQQDGTVILSVQDCGPGFPPEFEPVRDSHVGIELVRAIASTDLKGTVTFGAARDSGARAGTNVERRGARVEIAFVPGRLTD